MTANWILCFCNCSGSTGFRHSVGFEDRTAEDSLKELKHIATDRSRGCDHETNLTSEHCSDLAEDKFIIASRGIVSISTESFEFGLKTFVNKPLFTSSEGLELTFDSLVDLIVKTRYRWEEGWFEDTAIFNKLEWVSLEEPDLCTGHQSGHVDEVLEHMRCGQIRNVGVSLSHLDKIDTEPS